MTIPFAVTCRRQRLLPSLANRMALPHAGWHAFRPEYVHAARQVGMAANRLEWAQRCGSPRNMPRAFERIRAEDPGRRELSSLHTPHGHCVTVSGPGANAYLVHWSRTACHGHTDAPLTPARCA
jgi:hypothetical protein